MLKPLRRTRAPELMDRPDADARELARSLADLRVANRAFGGTRTMIGLLAPLIGTIEGGPVRVLDVATGSADIPMEMAKWGERRGREMKVVASDNHLQTLRVARARTATRPEVSIVGADALRLPFPDRAFHLVTCATALHHFEEDDAVRALREMARVASVAVVVLDLRRSHAALASVGLLAATAWRRHPITRHDGPVSVRASFTPDELRDLAARAGMEGARVGSHAWFRQSLVFLCPE